MEDVFTSRKAAYQRIQSRGGQVLDIFYYPVFDDKDRLYGGILHIKDVTKKVQLEAQLVESAKLAAIGEMAAGVAHELNSPLTVIIGNAQMLQRQFGAEHSASYLLKDIVTCGLRCKRIIQNLLTFARQEPPVVGPVDLNDAVERVLGLIGYQIKRYGITMYTEFAADLPRVWGDAHQLEQVLINLLLNARDALETVEREKYIRVATGMREAADGRRYATVIVEDNGEGIAAENVSKIFNPFFTTKEAVRGSGLGLSVSLGIAQAHGGTIEVESRFGEGSIFTLVLPLDRDDR
jgi:signal transduction histidine kinase